MIILGNIFPLEYMASSQFPLRHQNDIFNEKFKFTKISQLSFLLI